ADPVPLEHRKFRGVQRAPLAIAEDVRKRNDSRFSRGHELLHGEFGRRMQIGRARGAARSGEGRFKPDEMRLVAGGWLQRGRVDLDEALGLEPAPDKARDPLAREEPRAAFGVTVLVPERWGGGETQAASEG